MTQCPTAMADIAAALHSSPAKLREQTKVILVTTDPARDTAPVLRRWLDISTEFIGLLGTPAQVDAAQAPPASSRLRSRDRSRRCPADPTSTSTSAAPPRTPTARRSGTASATPT